MTGTRALVVHRSVQSYQCARAATLATQMYIVGREQELFRRVHACVRPAATALGAPRAEQRCILARRWGPSGDSRSAGLTGTR